LKKRNKRDASVSSVPAPKISPQCRFPRSRNPHVGERPRFVRQRVNRFGLPPPPLQAAQLPQWQSAR
jgi:hypothetical protein